MKETLGGTALNKYIGIDAKVNNAGNIVADWYCQEGSTPATVNFNTCDDCIDYLVFAVRDRISYIAPLGIPNIDAEGSIVLPIKAAGIVDDITVWLAQVYNESQAREYWVKETTVETRPVLVPLSKKDIVTETVQLPLVTVVAPPEEEIPPYTPPAREVQLPPEAAPPAPDEILKGLVFLKCTLPILSLLPGLPWIAKLPAPPLFEIVDKPF